MWYTTFMNQSAKNWSSYQLLDTGDKQKLEKWGDVILSRPDPVAIWPKKKPELWQKAQAIYHRSAKGGGHWEFKQKLPDKWKIDYGPLCFVITPTGFKHTGLFPEQAANWDWIMESVQEKDRVLNLFAYTGAASMAAATKAMEVVHVDAAKGMIAWAKENQAACHLQKKTIRFLVDDCLKFVHREARRNRRYDLIILDPPSYGRGPNQELWKLEDHVYELLQACEQILSPTGNLLINCYTTGFSVMTLKQSLQAVMAHRDGDIEAGENLIPIQTGGFLPCGIYAKWIGR